MGLDLFTHNLEAYHKLDAMLEKYGKACIIHPTGTGKSFIGFHLVEQHKKSKFLWLSPSVYIYKNQLENIKSLLEQKEFDDINNRILFMSYNKLTVNPGRAYEFVPDFILLDEFHRCGAPEWGKAVREVLDFYPGAKRVGLSATNIRYLDNRRNMAEELFDGKVASEMNLGEAIGKGILPAPKYVISMYSYKDEIEKISKRVQEDKDTELKEENEKLIEKLRRELENALGINEIFKKHITNPSGKFIAFCANQLHMEEMMSHVYEWFSEIDPEPHIYQVIYTDSVHKSEFTSFVNDESEHLKILFTVDMLNEGIHVKNLDGVILFRPTLSPNIYLQQIGRALTAGCEDRQPLILDIVNNFECMQLIEQVQADVDKQKNTSLSHVWGGTERSYEWTFTLIDEVMSCRKLFNKLNSNLAWDFDKVFRYAKRYYEENGNIDVPYKYVTAEGVHLGWWVSRMRQRHNTPSEDWPPLSEYEQAMLDSIGMCWMKAHDKHWDERYQELYKYWKEHGDIAISSDYPNSKSLVLWLRTQRANKRNGILSKEHEERLEDLGIDWDPTISAWEKSFALAQEYYQKYGNLDVMRVYQTDDGYYLGKWVKLQKDRYMAGKLTDIQISRLEAIGMRWEASYLSDAWEVGYEHLCNYVNETGTVQLPACYVCEDGYKLYTWVSTQRERCVKGYITDDQRKKLEALGVDLRYHQNNARWMDMYKLAQQYAEEHGSLYGMETLYETEDGIKLGVWVANQRMRYKARTSNKPNKPISDEEFEMLDTLGMRWEDLRPWRKKTPKNTKN